MWGLRFSQHWLWRLSSSLWWHVSDRFIPGVLEQDVASLFSSVVLGLGGYCAPLGFIIDCFFHHTVVCCQYESSRFLWNIATCLPKYSPLHPSIQWPSLLSLWDGKEIKPLNKVYIIASSNLESYGNLLCGNLEAFTECNWKFCLLGC